MSYIALAATALFFIIAGDGLPRLGVSSFPEATTWSEVEAIMADCNEAAAIAIEAGTPAMCLSSQKRPLGRTLTFDIMTDTGPSRYIFAVGPRSAILWPRDAATQTWRVDTYWTWAAPFPMTPAWQNHAGDQEELPLE